MKTKKTRSVPKKAGPKPSNPFEIKVHKVKHQVLGKKSTKEAIGNPNRKKQKGLDARKSSLLREYKNKNKSNLLRDKRLGENDASISLEEKMLKRFAKERLKSDKKTKYKLNDDDDEEGDQLTHLGQSVAEIQDMKAPAADSDFEDEDDEDFGRLGSEHVEKLHFGGGEEKSGEQSGKRKHADIIEEIIAKSKQAKYQRKVEKDETEEITGKLDDEWKSLAGLLGGIRPVKKDEDRKSTEKGISDDYDVLVRELMFDKKGVATDRLKTEEEIAKAEMEQLEALERERVIRMRGFDASNSVAADTHRSADDLDDGFVLDEEDKRRKKVGFTLAYKDGKAIVNEEEEEGRREGNDEDEDAVGLEGSGDGDDADNDDEDDSDEEEEGYSDVEDEGEDEKESDQEESDDGDEEEKEEAPSTPDSPASKKGILKRSGSSDIIATAVAAKREIPYTFVMPTTLAELDELLRPFNEKEQLIVIERIKKCHHPSLAEDNKGKLVGFFGLLLELFLESSASSLSLGLLDGLTRHLHEMLRLDHGGTGRQVHSQLVSLRENHDWRSSAPLRTCLFLQLVSRLYPTSDFTHPVVTPAFLFLGEILQRTSINSMSVVISGLFLSALALDYVGLAKRFMPEPLNFLNGVLFLARADSASVDFGKVVPPCRPVGKHNRLLSLAKVEDGKESSSSASSPATLTILTIESIPTDASKKRKSSPSSISTSCYKLGALSRCVDLLTRFRNLYKDLPALKTVFAGTHYFLGKLPSSTTLPHDLYVKIRSLLDVCRGGGESAEERAASSSSSSVVKLPRLTRLTRPKARPQALPQFEPKFDMEFDGRKRFAGDQARKDKLRLERQYKMEFKAAAKDLRQDAAFLANVKIAEQVAKDKKRAAKVKEIYGHLSTQEGEHKQMERMKKRK